MQRFRLIKPDWAKPVVRGKPNPNFIEEIEGPDTLENEFLPADLKVLNDMGYNIYFFPNYADGFAGTFVNGKDIDTFEFVFVDMDLKDGVYESKEAFLEKITEFPLEPSTIVDSGNGVHVYWKILDLTRDDYIALQFRLIQEFKTDKSVWTPLQLMRMPGYYNTKVHGDFKPAEALLNEEFAYTVEDFDDVLPEITEENAYKAINHINMLEGRGVEHDFDKLDLSNVPDKFLDLLDNNERIAKYYTNPKEASGDRSKADYALASLLFKRGFDLPETVAVIYSSQKARTKKGDARLTYVHNTVTKAYKERAMDTGFFVDNAYERSINPNTNIKLGDPVKGPSYWDALEHSWRKKEVLGLIAGAGAGKTAATLNIFKSMAEKNTSDDIFIFFSLEMTEGEIYQRWEKMVGNNPELTRRLYVVANEDDEGEPRHIGLQQVYWFSETIAKTTGKPVGAIAIDHIGVMNNVIDLTRQPNFGVEGERNGGYGDVRSISMETLCGKFKELAKKLDTFVIIQSQTTKAKGGNGDIPLGKDAAYGVSQFEWYVDYILTLWQPLNRLYDETDLRVLAWQYCKIREKNRGDRAKEFVKYSLYYDMDTGILRELDPEEMQEMEPLVKKANALRRVSEKQQEENYKNSPSPIKQLKLICDNR